MSKQTDLINVTDAITVSGSNVGIGKTNPSTLLDALGASGSISAMRVANPDVGLKLSAYTNSFAEIRVETNHPLVFKTNGNSEKMRIDSSGNLLVGTTTAPAFGNVNLGPSVYVTSALGDENSGIYMGLNGVYPSANGALTDNLKDLGNLSYRWDDVFATNGTIQTSDRNEKQDIEALNDAETAVAVACKGLLRKFRWIDSVAEKGDDARIHFGIIAQDLQDAFTAEGLDAGRYAMFISGTWWETQTDVPAVEAVDEVLDEDGNVVTEAVEAKEAYTRTDTYETLEEAPEGATERTRMGVRYPELLAFIIGAM